MLTNFFTTDLNKISLRFSFGIGFFFLLMFPELHLMSFVPFLIIAIYQKSHQKCLIYAFLTGCIWDLLSSDTPFGFYSLNFIMTTLLVNPQKKHFFAESLSTLPIMTFFFSFVSTFFQIVMLRLIDKKFALSAEFFFYDFLVMPLLDTLFSFVFFVLPGLLLGRRRQKRDAFF